MPVYNCEQYINDSVQSILNQTFKDFELIIIDDKSTDDTVDLIKKFEDDRIVLIEKEKNSGYTDSLNYAVTIAKGDYIARMDGDDISMPERFKIQIDFLTKNEDVILCGTGMKVIDSDKILKHPSNYEEIKVKLCFTNSIFHPTVLFRKKVLIENQYDKNFEPAEDYDLWTRLVFKGKLMNIDETLLHYRLHANQVSNSKREIQINAATLAQLRMFQVLFDDEIITIEKFKEAFNFNDSSKIENLLFTLKFFKKAQIKNNQFKIYNELSFNENIEQAKISYLKHYFYSNGWSLRYLKVYILNISISEFLTIMNLKSRIINKLKRKLFSK